MPTEIRSTANPSRAPPTCTGHATKESLSEPPECLLFWSEIHIYNIYILLGKIVHLPESGTKSNACLLTCFLRKDPQSIAHLGRAYVASCRDHMVTCLMPYCVAMKKQGNNVKGTR